MSVNRDEIKRRALAAIDQATDEELERAKKNKQYAHDWLQRAVGYIKDLMKILAGTFIGCFITTAISERKGYDDDCEMMQNFRQLRKELRLTFVDFEKDYTLYCYMSPSIVSWANSRSDSILIWQYLDNVVTKTHTIFLEGNNLLAYDYFKNSILNVRKKIAMGIYED